MGIPDTLKAAGGGAMAANYKAGAGAITARRVGKEPCGVLLGFPLEAALPTSRHGQILSRLVSYCLPATPPADGGITPDASRLDGSAPGKDAGRKDGAAQGKDGHDAVPHGAPLEYVLYGGSGCAATPGAGCWWPWALLLALLAGRRRLG